jgi:hypothetical protein
MSWYRTGRECFSLRKHTMRADLRVYVSDPAQGVPAEAELASKIKSVLSSAIISGLDVVGIVAPQTPQIGWMAHELAKASKIDLWVVPGEEYMTRDGATIVAYFLQQPMPHGLDMLKALSFIRQNGGFSMVVKPTKRQAQALNKLVGTGSEPDAVEIYNGVSGGFQDIDVEFTKFVNSAATVPNELERSAVYTLVSRKELESMGLLPENYGEDYEPEYLSQKSLGQQPQMQPYNQIPTQGDF